MAREDAPKKNNNAEKGKPAERQHPVNSIRIREGIYAQEMDFDTAARYLAAVAERRAQELPDGEPMLISLCGNDRHRALEFARAIQGIIVEKYGQHRMAIMSILPGESGFRDYNNFILRSSEIAVPLLILDGTILGTDVVDLTSAERLGRFAEIVVLLRDEDERQSIFNVAEGVLEKRAVVARDIAPKEYGKEIPFLAPEIIVVRPEQ